MPTGATSPTTRPASPWSSRAAMPRCVSRPYAADGLSAVSTASETRSAAFVNSPTWCWTSCVTPAPSRP